MKEWDFIVLLSSSSVSFEFMIALNLIRIHVRIILREWYSSSMIWYSQSSKCCSVSVLAVALVSALLTHDRVEVDEAWSPTYCSKLHWQSPVSAQSSVLSEFTAERNSLRSLCWLRSSHSQSWVKSAQSPLPCELTHHSCVEWNSLQISCWLHPLRNSC